MSIFKLFASNTWPKSSSIPTVSVDFTPSDDTLSFLFDVSDPKDCFRCQCTHNGQPCWKDSCVEIFIHSTKLGGYYNFETNANGFCLAEFGKSRTPRRAFSPDEYCLFQRTVILPPTCENDRIHWRILISIPRPILGLNDTDPVIGNLYKCASGAPTPHYLMAFPIDTPEPDFHRPEFFQTLSVPFS